MRLLHCWHLPPSVVGPEVVVEPVVDCPELPVEHFELPVVGFGPVDPRFVAENEHCRPSHSAFPVGFGPSRD